MLCKNPFVRDPSGKVFHSTNKDDWLRGVPFPCGQCLACRINKRRVWTTRLYLEAMAHSDNLPMLTLTYDDEHLPISAEGYPTLYKRHIQLFLKRVRKAIYPTKIRYYCAGEYGEHTHRPHYHIMVFGLSPLFIQHVVNCWPFGLVHQGYDTSYESLQYVAGYVTKKFIKKSDSEGRQPEFALMSRKPALGAPSLKVILEVFEKHPEIVKSVLRNPSLKINGRFSPIGRTLADKLHIIMDVDNTSDDWLYEIRKLALDSSRNYNPMSDVDNDGPLVQVLLEESRQRNVQIEKHSKIWNRRSKI